MKKDNVPRDLASWEQEIGEMAKPRPIYTPERVDSVTALRYDCSAWLSAGAPFPAETDAAVAQTKPHWQKDGLALDRFRIKGDMIQLLFTAGPEVAPSTFVARIKGRLQHALRQAGNPISLSRKVSFRSLGDNISDAVSGYLAKQARKEPFADRRFAKTMEQFIVVDDQIDLSQPSATNRGRYWYNLHLVFVVPGRRRISRNDVLAKLRDDCLRVGRAKGYRIKALSVMLDHVHIALRGLPDQSPQDIALCFMNNLAWMNGYNRIWDDHYYAGTFSEYAVSNLPHQRDKPVGGAGGGKSQ